MTHSDLRALAAKLDEAARYWPEWPSSKLLREAAAALTALVDERETLMKLLRHARVEIDYWADTAREHDLVARIDAALRER